MRHHRRQEGGSVASSVVVCCEHSDLILCRWNETIKPEFWSDTGVVPDNDGSGNTEDFSEEALERWAEAERGIRLKSAELFGCLIPGVD